MIHLLSKVLGSDDAMLAPRKIRRIGLEANLATAPVTSELVVALAESHFRPG